MQSLVAIELEKTKCKPADAGQLNFYLNVLPKKLSCQGELQSRYYFCKEKNTTVVEFAFKSFDKAMGFATYRKSR